MSSPALGHSWVRAFARLASHCYPSSFRRGHADDFIEVADHHFDRESANRPRSASAALAVSKVILQDTLASAPAMWMDTLTGGDRTVSAPRALWTAIAGQYRGGRDDLRLAARAVRRRPGFSLVVILTLGIGMGASTAAFDALDRAIIRPLPFPRGHELTLLIMKETQQQYVTSVPIAALNEWRAKATTVRQVEVFRRMSAVHVTESGSDVREVLGVSGGLAPMLGIRPIVGRLLTSSDAAPGAPAAVMISESYWRSVFGGRADVVGQKMTLGVVPTEIVGVWPSGGRLDFFEEPDVFRALPAGAEYKRGNWVQVIARMQPGRSVAEVEQELALLTPPDPERPNSTLKYKVEAITPGALLLGDQFVTGVWLVFAGGLILLAASIVNAGHLLLERAASRQQELGVRLALGGSRARLFRMFLAEGVVYASAALAAGALIAIGLERMIASVEPRLYRDAAGAGIFGRAFLFAAGVSVLAALCCSLAPLARTKRRDVSATLSKHSGRVAAGRSPLTTTLVAVQSGFAVLLVFGAALMAHSLDNLRSVDPGIDLPRLAELSVSLPAARYTQPEQRAHYFTQARAALEALPGVTGVVTSGMPLLQASLMSGLPSLESEPVPTPPPDANTAMTSIRSEYFRIMGIRTIAGRAFTDDELNVAVVDETFANPRGGSAVIGQRLRMPGNSSAYRPYEIIGVVKNVRYAGLANDKNAWPAVYVPSASLAGSADVSAYERFIVRTDGDPRDVITGARHALAVIDPQVPLLGPSTGPEVFARQTAQHRFVALLLTGLASMGFVLAMGGVYGAVALSVSRRKRDVGLRLALGAQVNQLVAMFVRNGLQPVMLGAAAGAAAVWFAAPRLEVLLFRVPPHDPISGGVGVGLVLIVAAAAALVPARRICRIDPAETLREN